jgi:uncharacterized protein (TIGR02646 family)
LIVRSLDKGEVPKQVDGRPTVFEHYRDAWPYLAQRMGRYCAYCERTIPASLAVEHKLPKSSPRHKHLEREWSNFLLGCSNCNSSKLDREFREHSPLWPDEEDTFSMIEYHENGAVRARADLADPAKERVHELLNLVGLDKTPARIGPSDHRFFDRLEVWRKAEQCAIDLRNEDSPALRRATIEVAKSSGGFSIWRKAFERDADLTQALVAAFPGTREPNAGGSA